MTDELASLRRARAVATGFLVAVVALYASTFAVGDAAWVGYVQAAAEAGVIGGLADWFAVTALFRHPLGIPIPHTAIIPRSKDRLGRNLALFMAANFLDPATVRERLAVADPVRRFGRWLSVPEHAVTAAGHLSELAKSVASGLASGPVAGDIERIVGERLQVLPVAEMSGKAIEKVLESGEHREIIRSAIRGIDSTLRDQREFLRKRLGAESPWWVPESIDDVVFERAMEIAHRFLHEVATDDHHEMRRMLDVRLTELAHRLQTDPDLAERVATRVAQLAERPVVRLWIRQSWTAVVAGLTHTGEPLARALEDIGTRLATDPAIADRVETWLDELAVPVAELARREVEVLIPATVDRWDPRETSDRLEGWLGRDLQFVRINGTVVGALIGLLIHTVVTALA
jgi:uncharacterized membrane-anchored protein YjiN (DUF445 family)